MIFGVIFASSLEGEVDSAQRWRVGDMLPSRRDRSSGEITPHPDLRSDLPLKGGGDGFVVARL